MNMPRLLALCGVLICLLPILAAAQPGPALPAAAPAAKPATAAPAEPPPAGVTVEVLPEPEKPAAAEGAEADKPATEAAAKPDDKKPVPQLELAYDGCAFEDVLADLSARLKVIVLCADEKLYSRKYYRHLSIPADEALQYVCGTMLQYARPAYILCTKAEKLEGDYNPAVTDKVRLKIRLQDAVLGDALAYIAKLANVGLSATPDTWDTKVTFQADEITLEKLAEALAKEAKCEQVTGFVLQGIGLKQIHEGIDKLKAMKTEDLDKMVRGGMQGFDEARAGGEMGLGNPAASMKDNMDTFNSLDPAERAEIVGEIAGIITEVAGLVRTLPADTQNMIKQRAQPFMGLAVGGFLRMPGSQRAEFAPIIGALRNFGW
jgi:hypothetical protein